MKITKITIQQPNEATIPDGFFKGVWGGYIITLKYNNKVYELTTEKGVRGFNIDVVVTIKDGIATFKKLSN